MAIAHGDGSLRKTTKSSLMSVLEKNVTALPSLPPSLVPTACVIDAMALIQVMKSATSATVGEMEEQYLFCFGLFWFVLFCFVLVCFVLFCFVLFCFVLFCFVLFCFCCCCCCRRRRCCLFVFIFCLYFWF